MPKETSEKDRPSQFWTISFTSPSFNLQNILIRKTLPHFNLMTYLSHDCVITSEIYFLRHSGFAELFPEWNLKEALY